MPDGNVKSFEQERYRKHLEKLSQQDSVSDADFADAVYRALSLWGLAEADFRDVFGLTQGAVERWTTGKNLPQPLVRPRIIKWISEQCENN